MLFLRKRERLLIRKVGYMLQKESDVYSKYREKLRSIFEENNQHLSIEMLEEFENYLRDNWSVDDIKLYRYSKADYFNVRNFETGKIKLTSNGVLNDIFEGLPQGINDEQINSINDIVYMKCFSTDQHNALMWSHYADENKGICVEYDLGILEHSNPILKHIYPVIYEKNRLFKLDVKEISEIVEEQKWLNYDIKQNGISNYDDLLQALLLFLFKSEDWAYENEWRIVFSKADLYLNDFVDFSNLLIDFDCATGIYLGYRINPEIKKNIIEIVDRINSQRKIEYRDGISVYEMRLRNDTYNFEPYKIK